MKKIILFIIIAALFIMGCATTQPKPEVKAPAQEQLTKADIAIILMLAIQDIEKQGCKAEFLSERGGYIWCRCKDGKIKWFGLKELVEKYREGKQKAKEAQDVKKTGGN